MNTLAPIELGTIWERICKDPRFQNLGYKIEIQPNGDLHMSPGNIRHGLLQAEVAHLLRTLLTGGRPSTETAIQTSRGILVPDVCWCSDAFLEREGDRYSAETAPEICVEVMSASNTLVEMEDKRAAYFEAGCEEFLLVDAKGFVSFFAASGPLEQSGWIVAFPSRIAL